jgi:hypothetical protein
MSKLVIFFLALTSFFSCLFFTASQAEALKILYYADINTTANALWILGFNLAGTAMAASFFIFLATGIIESIEKKIKESK